MCQPKEGVCPGWAVSACLHWGDIHLLPPVDRILTHAGENIIFPQLHLQTVKKPV